MLGIASFTVDWYNGNASINVKAYGRGLERVAMNLAPLRPAS